MRPLRRARRERGAREAQVPALVLGHVGGPGRHDGAEVVVAHPPALPEGQPEAAELLLVPADTHTEDEAPARRLVHGRRRLGRHERVAVGQDDHAGAELDAPRAAGEVRQERERIRPVRAIMLRGGGLGQDMVRDEDPVEPELLRPQRERLRLADRELPDR